MRSFMLLASTPQMHLLEPRRLLALPTADADPSHLLAVGGTLYFSANDADHGFELWKSDGTEAGTVLVKDILHGQGSSDPHNLVAIGNNVYFNVTDAAGHVQLWTSDGTATGTMLVADLCSLAAITQSGDTVVLDNVLYITAHDGDEFSALFKSDGTSSEVVKEFTGPHVQDLIAADNVLYLSAPDPTHGRELWKSDGTEAGTVLVKDINPGTANSNPFSFTSDFVVLNGAIYFAATTTTNGTELWKSDGTGAGTVLVKDINPQGSAGVGGFVTLNGAIFFSAEDPEHGRELWRSDGTAAGTVLLKDINPGLEESAPAPLGFRLLAAAGMLYFSAGDGTHGRELWKSDGTSAGTVLVKDIQPGNSGSVPRAFASLNGLLYFSATDGDQFDSPPGHGFEYWKSDGTEFGTELLKDINPGTGHSALGFEPQIVVGNGSVFFAADDGTHGVELWRSDGTTEGTTLLADINLQGPPFPFTRFSLETRVWQVFGSDRDDRIDVTISDGTYFATRNGITESIDVSQVSQVHIFGNGGNDRIIASTVTLPVPGAPGDEDRRRRRR